jgi:phospho-N-acetylmuramoyl-pentapeptide-transferase
MFKEFLFPLVEYFSPFNIFQYITFRAAYASITALLVTFIFAPGIIAWLRRKKLGETIRTDGPQSHQSKSGTPSMGGILIIISTVISVLLWQDLHQVHTWIGLLAIVGFGGIGFLDDYIKIFRKNKAGLPGRAKLVGQFAVSLAICVLLYLNSGKYQTYLYLPFLKEPILDMSWVFIPFGILLLVFFSNAVNLTDGLDGLATGLAIMAALAFAVISYISGRADWSEYLQFPQIAGAGEMTVLILALIGACIGFLWYNSNPAEIFMGDTGSLMLGGVLGFLALMLKKEVLLVIIGGVFVMEGLSVMIQVASFKLRKGKRVFLMAPLHHHFELKGWAENKVVLRFWILGGLFAILSLSTLKIH